MRVAGAVRRSLARAVVLGENAEEHFRELKAKRLPRAQLVSSWSKSKSS